MFCDRCGANLQGPVSFCPHCGRQFGAPPPPLPAQNRVSGHLRNLAILLAGVFRTAAAARSLPELVLGLGISLHPRRSLLCSRHLSDRRAASSSLTGVIGLIAGWGLYERRSWARILAIVLAFLSLFHPPFGTAIGIYTLWVLMPAASEAEYQRIARG